LEYVKGLYDNFIPGTASWNDSSNNKAFLAGQLFLTVNGISIYVTAKRENPQIAEDMNHAHLPAGVDGKTRNLISVFRSWSSISPSSRKPARPSQPSCSIPIR